MKQPTPKGRRAPREWWIAAALFGLCAAGMLFAYWQLAGPDLVLLLPDSGARWLLAPEPVRLGVHSGGKVQAAFRARIRVDRVPTDAVLTVRALKAASVVLDGVRILPAVEQENWKDPRRVEFGSKLTPGAHSIGILVSNDQGPCAVLAYCEAIGLRTDARWQATSDGKHWTPARLADQSLSVDLSRQFPAVSAAFAKHALLFGFLFVSVGAISLFAPQFFSGPRSVLIVRCVLPGLWVLLAINNFVKLPVGVGFDLKGHMDYVQHIATKHRLPLANEGWEMFQPPLYYLLEAAGRAVVSAFDPETMWRILRLLSVMSGVLQIELCFRATRYLWPERSDLQAIGAIFGGVLPMNLYVSQLLGNEPLAGALSAAAVVLAIKVLSTPPELLSRWTLPGLGLLLGLALLTKVTPVLLLPPVAVVLIVAFRRATWPKRARAFAAVYGVGFVVAGWYYLRNCWYFGKPFVGNWSPEAGPRWWQEPGYRSLSHLYRFGTSLELPIYSGLSGFWDALYSTFWLDGWLCSEIAYDARPPWNYDFMLACAWLAILPTIAILWGMCAAFRPANPVLAKGLRFAAGCVALYLGTMLWFSLKLPAYSTVKAPYTVGVTPCYAVLAVAGFERMTRLSIPRAAVYAALACWAMASYLSYFAS